MRVLFLGLLLGRRQAFEALEEFLFRHALDRDFGVVGIDGSARSDQRHVLRLGLVHFHIFLQ